MQNDILRSEGLRSEGESNENGRVQLDGKIRYMSTSVVDNHSGWLEIVSLRVLIALILALLSRLAHALSTDGR
eukprot:4427392-Amphidinium_carterae.1